MTPGAVIGTIVALRIQMTAMPQLVAALHSFVGWRRCWWPSAPSSTAQAPAS
jgi:NAD/NADP transhydrogenase beta subunit